MKMGLLKKSSKRGSILLSVVTPCLNEEHTVEDFLARATKAAEKITSRWEVIIVDDGSGDATWRKICLAHKSEPRIKGLKLSKNHGHQTALTAGLHACSGLRVLMIDSDLQDPPELVGPMNQVMSDQQADVVHAVRKSRKGETWFKLLTASAYYWLLSFMSGMRIPKNSGDFKLLSRRVVDAINRMPEGHRYLRGMVWDVGFKQVLLEYERKPRFKGKTKFGLFRMMRFALDGITSFSMKPLRFATGAGLLTGIAGLSWAMFSSLDAMRRGAELKNLSLLVPLFLFFSGLQLAVAGIMGEYVGRIFEQVKRRPLFNIADSVGLDENIRAS